MFASSLSPFIKAATSASLIGTGVHCSVADGGGVVVLGVGMVLVVVGVLEYIAVSASGACGGTENCASNWRSSSGGKPRCCCC